MDTLLLKTFLAVAKTRNFTKVGKQLYCSQSAVSLQMARLEDLLGKKLFKRDQRKVSLTLEGEELLAYAEQILTLEQEMLNHFQEPCLSGEVTFGTPEDLATAYLPHILGNFAHQHPGIVLNVHCEFTLNLLKGFDLGFYDLILIKQDPQNPHPQSEVVWKETLVWVGRKSQAQIDKEKKAVQLVLAPAPCVYRQRAIDSLNRAGIPWRIVYNSPSLAGTLAAVKAGVGVSILPSNMISKELVMIKTLPSLKDAQIALLKKEKISLAAKALADDVASSLWRQPPF